MRYRFVAIDLDDTLLSDDLMISPSTIRAIQEAVKKGVTITLATGRMFQSAKQFAEKININVPIITYQGACIRNIYDKGALYQRLLPKNIAVDVISKLKKNGKKVQIYIDDELIVEKDNPYIHQYSKVTNVNYQVVDDLGEEIKLRNKQPLKILTIDKPEEIKKMEIEYREIYRNKMHITISKPHFLEFSHLEATKGQAIAYLTKKMGISLDEVIAIGDSYNDYDMIKMAGLGVAMENANPDIKKIADYITKTNNDEGVTEVLNRYILNP